MSVLAWLDHDESERRRMQELIELFRERDSVDELGIGSVRDAFSNLLFPGTSVLHTRARYFLFIPWIYSQLERQRVQSSEIEHRARRDEVRLIYALLEGQEGEGSGVIGAVAKDDLKQLPSYAYWNGLEVIGIRLYHGSIDHYHRSLDRYYELLGETPRSEGDEPIEGVRSNWDPGLPPSPDGFLESTEFALLPAEANYLRDRIHAAAPRSLLDVFVRRGRPTRVQFAWLHPDVAKLPTDVGTSLQLAHVFSGVMHGASLLYNLMLAEAKEAQRRVEEYRSRLADWLAARNVPAEWSWDEFWTVALSSNPRIPIATRNFVEAWFGTASAISGPEDARARALISDRERVTKRGQARLHNRRALELWGGSSGAAQQSFRWPVVQALINDILRGAKA